jgi:hypothetical protein
VREIVHTDLTALEGEPTPHADIQRERVSHSTELRWLGASVKNTTVGPAYASAHIGSVLLQLSIAGAISAGIIGVVLGGLSAVSGRLVVIAVLIAFTVPILAGVSMLLRNGKRRAS